MKLFYYKDGLGNFGDDLNPLIWYSLFPDLFRDQSDSDTILGIGTLINDRAPSGTRIHVLGSGAGYHGEAKIDKNWNFEFVRGPNSCRKLGLDMNKAITDPAILVARIFPARKQEQKSISGRVSYMPHHASSRFADWRSICKSADLEYLDPADDLSTTIHRISGSDFVIAEAMHAAIVADAMRVPWVAVKTYPHIFDFKWIDWCSSVGVEYRPLQLEPVWDMEQFTNRLGVLKSEAKHVLISIGFSGSGWTPPLMRNNSADAMPKAIESLLNIKKMGVEQLSKTSTHSELLERVEAAITTFCKKFPNI